MSIILPKLKVPSIATVIIKLVVVLAMKQYTAVGSFLDRFGSEIVVEFKLVKLITSLLFIKEL